MTDNPSNWGNYVTADSQFALDLLARPTIGDWTLAGKLVIWAGGAGHSYKQDLQSAFKLAAKEKKQAFKTPMRQSLEELGLLPRPRKGIIQAAAERIFDN